MQVFGSATWQARGAGGIEERFRFAVPNLNDLVSGYRCKRRKQDKRDYLHRKAELHELKLDLALRLVIQDILARLLACCTFRTHLESEQT